MAIEFTGPLVLAVVLSRRPRDLLWVALAGPGSGCSGSSRPSSTRRRRLRAARGRGHWAAYILLSARTGSQWAGLDGLTVASVVATLVLMPWAMRAGGGELRDPRILMLGAAVGLLSSVIPYSAELMALRRIRPDVFSILMSLEPAAAALAGMLVLQEFLTPCSGWRWSA